MALSARLQRRVVLWQRPTQTRSSRARTCSAHLMVVRTGIRWVNQNLCAEVLNLRHQLTIPTRIVMPLQTFLDSDADASLIDIAAQSATEFWAVGGEMGLFGPTAASFWQCKWCAIARVLKRLHELLLAAPIGRHCMRHEQHRDNTSLCPQHQRSHRCGNHVENSERNDRGHVRRLR